MSVVDDPTPYDNFTYAYTIALNDADRTKPITARLQLRDVKGGGWQEVSGSSRSYSGSSPNWDGSIIYDMFSVDIGTEPGVLREMRVVCDYTMKNGAAGTIYSTSCGSIWSYAGDYLSPVSAELRDGKLTAKFQVDSGLILDLSKVTPTELVLWSGSSSYDLLGKAEITGPEADGSITVSYTLNGETLNTLVYNDLDLRLNYKDMGGAIDWSCVSLVQFDAHTAPTLSLFFGGWVEPGAYEPGCGVACDLQLNDLLGGQAFITMQKLGSGGWETDTDFGTLEYNASVADDHGILEFAYKDPELSALWGVDDVGRRYKAKFVISYIYPDGVTGTLESPVFEQYGGGFAHYANSPAITYDAENKQLVAEVVIDLSLVEPENVAVIAGSATHEWSSIGTPTLSRVYTAGDGSLRWVFTVPLEELSPGEYSFDIGLRYYNGMGPRWEQELFAYNDIS